MNNHSQNNSKPPGAGTTTTTRYRPEHVNQKMVYAKSTTLNPHVQQQYRFKITEIYWFLLTVQKKKTSHCHSYWPSRVLRMSELTNSKCKNWKRWSTSYNSLSALLQLPFRINNPRQQVTLQQMSKTKTIIEMYKRTEVSDQFHQHA